MKNSIINNVAPIATTVNGIEVFSHPAGHPHREDLLSETISKIALSEDKTFHRETVDLGRVIGKDHLVETKPEDQIVYLRRGNRAGETRMVLKEAADTSFVTIILCVARKDEETPDELVGKWVVVTLFEGQPGEREPWDNAFIDADIDEDVATGKAKAEAFWASHALVPTEKEMEEIEEGQDIYCGKFQFEFEVSDSYCMSGNVSKINGRWFNVYDFGSHEDTEWRYRTEEDGYGCVNGTFVPNEYTKEIGEKYHITEEQFDMICEELKEQCSWGHCGSCD